MPTSKEVQANLDILEIHRTRLLHYIRQASIHGEAYVPPAVSHGIREARADIENVKKALRAMGQSVEDRPEELTTPRGQDEKVTSEAQGVTQEQVKDTRLKQVLTAHFDKDDLQELCFEIGIEYEELAGSRKSAKVISLIKYAQRHGMYDTLVDHTRTARPGYI